MVMCHATDCELVVIWCGRALCPLCVCFVVLIECCVPQTCHMIRITRIRYGFWPFLSYTAVLHFDTDFN